MRALEILGARESAPPVARGRLRGMLCRALGALGRAGRGGIRLAPSVAPLRSAFPALAQRITVEPAAIVANVVCEEQPCNYVLPLLAAGAVAAILMPDTSDCMGKRKKKGTEEADEMYEVDHIVARRLVRGAPEYLVRWKGYDEKSDTWEPLSSLCGLEPDLSEFDARAPRI